MPPRCSGSPLLIRGQPGNEREHCPFFILPLRVTIRGKEVSRDEETAEQESDRKRGSLLECDEAAGETESWNGMPQVKRLKELSCWSATKEKPAGGADLDRNKSRAQSFPPFCSINAT